MRENKDPPAAALTLEDFTARYVKVLVTNDRRFTRQSIRYTVALPRRGDGDAVYWQPRPAAPDQTLAQENLIVHLLMQQLLRQTPTLFIGTTASELTIISLCNLIGQVLRKQVGGKWREVLAANLAGFLTRLAPRLLG